MMMDGHNLLPQNRGTGAHAGIQIAAPRHRSVVAMPYRPGKPFSSSAAEIGSIMRASLTIANGFGVAWHGGRHTISIAVASIPQFSSIRFQ
jgi:hypothetical protein